jgi:hypothetical protein
VPGARIAYRGFAIGKAGIGAAEHDRQLSETGPAIDLQIVLDQRLTQHARWKVLSAVASRSGVH